MKFHRKFKQRFLPDFKVIKWRNMNINYYLWEGFKKLNKKTIRTIFKEALSQKSIKDFTPPHPFVSGGTISNNVCIVKNILNINNTVIYISLNNSNKKNILPLTSFLSSIGNRRVWGSSQLIGGQYE